MEENFSNSTMIVSGRVPREEYEKAVSDMRERDAVLELCPKCGALLDVSGCRPLTETTCPSCGALIKVLMSFHHFVLLSVLGQGGAGTVYRAFDQTLERDVALKLLRNEHTRDPAYLEGLEREALITASISHPHVVKVYSTGRQNGFYYIAMEIVTGGSLAERIRRQGRLPEAQVLSLGIQLAEGLQAAYARGLLHRDVKPGNMLFADQETLKVSDFGLALPLDQAKGNEDDIWGTPDYIAPEKLLRQGEDVRSDLYSVGCTLFHCLAGAPPLDTTTVMMVIRTQRPQPAPNIQTRAPEISGATASLIKHCLENNPTERFQSYEELITQLQYVREKASNGVTLKPQSKRMEAAPRGRPDSDGKRRAMKATAAFIMLALVLGSIAAFHYRTARIESTSGSGRHLESTPLPVAEIRPEPPAIEPHPVTSPVGPDIKAAAPDSTNPETHLGDVRQLETESLTAVTSGKEHHILGGADFSKSAGTILNATAEGDIVTYTVPQVVAGSYEVKVGVNNGPARGIWRMAIGREGAPAYVLSLAKDYDEYTPSPACTEVDVGRWDPHTDGDKLFQFKAVGKNPNSTSYAIALDYIKLVPLPPLPVEK